jgi:hypothetical protein
MITPARGLLVTSARTGTQNLATTHFFDPEAMAAAIRRALALSDAELDGIGAAARAWYEANDRAFRGRINTAVSTLK